MISLKFNLIHHGTHLKKSWRPSLILPKVKYCPRSLYTQIRRWNPAAASFHARLFPAASGCCHNAHVLFLMTRGTFCLFREEFPLMYCFGNTEIKFVSKLSGEVFLWQHKDEGRKSSAMSHKDRGISFCVYVMLKNKTDTNNGFYAIKVFFRHVWVFRIADDNKWKSANCKYRTHRIWSTLVHKT